VMRSSAAVLVTTSWRAEWLRSRRWLPSRPVAFAPVFSNLPPPAGKAHPDGRPPAVGLFGYNLRPTAIALVLDALAVLQREGVKAQLLLIGAPGPDSPVARAWLEQARARHLEHAPVFSGTLPAQELSDRLAECEVLLYAEPAGPMSRKGTLAASLASGRPVLALDGPRTWRELVAADAAVVVAPRLDALAEALSRLLTDAQERESFGARGRAFAAQTMTPAYTAGVLRAAIAEILGAGS